MDRHVSVGNILERLCGRTGSGPGLRGRAGLAGSRGVEGSVAGSLADGMSHAGRRYGLCGGGKASQGWWGPESEGGEENIEDEERERERKRSLGANCGIISGCIQFLKLNFAWYTTKSYRWRRSRGRSVCV